MASATGQPRKEVERVIQLLVDQGELGHLGAGLYMSSLCLQDARQAVIENCEANNKLEIPVLRDRLGTSRKYLIPLLEHFDTEGLTLRRGGTRILKRR